MRGFTKWAVISLASAMSLVGQSGATPMVVQPGGPADVRITEQDTLNGTFAGAAGTQPGSNQLPLSIVNNFPGDGQINVYVTGLDAEGQIVILQPDGTFNYPPATTSTTAVAITVDVAIPIGGSGSTTTITLPDCITSARLWFAEGNLTFYTVLNSDGVVSLVEPLAVNPLDPSGGVNWGFVELSYNNDGLYANISYVDSVGLVLGMSLLSKNGSTQTALGVQATAVSSICNDLIAQAAIDGQPWNELCVTDVNGVAIRVLAPNHYISQDPSAFSSYFTDYVDMVWSTFSSSPLTINTQTSAGNVVCTTSGSDVLTCDGDNRGYSKPTAADIFGCSTGPFAIELSDNAIHHAVVPRLCAAFNRSTFLLPGGNLQPSLPASSYYLVQPTNCYSRIVHMHEVDGKGYAFAYDDVNPEGENQSGVVTSDNPQVLSVIVGGPLS
jgi:hypothetical protein